MEAMKCNLCLQDKELLKNSHIIPDFMYRELFDEKHRFVKGNLISKKGKMLQSGEKEPNILCASCDNVLLGSNLEGYANKVLYGGNIGAKTQIQTNQHGVTFTYTAGIDYKKFKLFLLSLIWRCSISNRDFYENVDLGPYEETLRTMIYSGNPGTQMEFPCLMSTYRYDHNLPVAVVSKPTKFRQDNGGSGYAMLVGGIVYQFYISKDKSPSVLSETSISEAGELRVVHLTPDQARNLLNFYFQAKIFT
jgi:hypothetical protein